MKIIGYYTAGPIAAPDSLLDLEAPRPVARGRDVLVQVHAVSVNPVDTKVRANAAPTQAPRVLGWDAAGVVVAIGPDVTLFQVGDEVFYAGAIDRPGSNAEFQLVDERIVGRKPISVDFAGAAALPLTGITSWELLFDRLKVRMGKPADAGAILILGGAGGVGSILTQLARRLTGLTVIATASRPESQDWAREMGAHHVIDHSRPLAEQVRAIVPEGVTHAVALTHSAQHFEELVKLIRPQGQLALIDDPATPLPIDQLKTKSISLHWEFMFTRAKFETPDMIAQHRLLNEVADLVDAGVLKTTMRRHLGPMSAASLKQAHALIESAATIGKIVLDGVAS